MHTRATFPQDRLWLAWPAGRKSSPACPLRRGSSPAVRQGAALRGVTRPDRRGLILPSGHPGPARAGSAGPMFRAGGAGTCRGAQPNRRNSRRRAWSASRHPVRLISVGADGSVRRAGTLTLRGRHMRSSQVVRPRPTLSLRRHGPSAAGSVVRPVGTPAKRSRRPTYRHGRKWFDICATGSYNTPDARRSGRQEAV
jgi:hypothetical protein